MKHSHEHNDYERFTVPNKYSSETIEYFDSVIN